MAYLTLETGEFRRTFHSRGDLEDWWQSEKEAWSWLAEAPDDRFTDVIAKFRNVDAVFAEPEGKEHIARALKALFHPSHLGPRPSQSDEGMRILDAYQLTGRTPAMQFMLLDMAPSQINWRGDPVGVAAALKAASAAYALAKLDKAVFNSERRAYREGLGRIESKFQKLEADQRAGYASRRKAYRLAARKLFERSRKLWNDGQSKMYTENWEAVSSIQETEQRYKVQMALAAPVQYWKDKAKSHGSWEVAWGL
ncbi:hypothetical protein [Novosphingobium pentaromativorans]|nr:hypothetical protein [Novosphingobium pentaromativorans]